MSWKHEWKALGVFAGIFLVFFFFPFESLTPENAFVRPITEALSVANPWNPTSQGTYIPGGIPKWLMTQDDYLYVSNEEVFEILDISNPIAPLYQGSVLGQEFQKFKHTAIDGLFAYVGGGWQHGCYPMITTLWPPDSPSIVYIFDPWEYQTPTEMEVSNGILYMGTSNGLRIYDLY